MADYHVHWEVEVEAESHKVAAREALAMMRDPASIATVFTVTDPKGWQADVDLSRGTETRLPLLVDSPDAIRVMAEELEGPGQDIRARRGETQDDVPAEIGTPRFPAAPTTRPVTVVSACHNANGAPDFALAVVEVTEAEIELGEHYDKAEEDMRDRDYEGPFVHFDQGEAPAFLIPAVKQYLGD